MLIVSALPALLAVGGGLVLLGPLFTPNFAKSRFSEEWEDRAA